MYKKDGLVVNIQQTSKWTISGFLTFCFIVLYVFLNNVDMGAGALEIFPYVKRLMNPHFLANDFFTNSTEGYNARYYLSILLAFLSGIFSIENVFHVINVATLSLVLFSLYIFGKTINNGSKVAGLITLAIASFPAQFGIVLGQWYLINNQLQAKNMVAFLFIFAFVFLLKGNLKRIVISTGVASIFHPLEGILVGGILLPAYLISSIMEKGVRISELKKFFLWSAVMLLFLSVNIVPLVLLSKDCSLNATDFINIYVNYRHPHHYLPSSWPIFNYLICAAAALISLFIAKKIEWQTENKRKIFIVAIIILLLCILGYLFTEIYPTRTFATLGLFRLTRYLYLMFSAIAAGYIYKIICENRLYEIFKMMVIRAFEKRWIKHILYFSAITILVLTFFVHQHERFGSVFNLLGLPSKYERTYKVDQIITVCNFIKTNTSEDANVIIPFGMWGYMTRYYGERAVVVDGCFPFMDKYMLEWHKRSVKVRALYRNYSDKKVKTLAHDYKATHIILPQNIQSDFEIINNTKDFKLLKISA